MKTTTILALFIALTGCAADIPYTKLGDSWASGVGYSDFEIGNNKYKVMYTGGVYNSPTTVTQYAYRRAKELCAEKGFNDYIATNSESSNKPTSFNSVPNIAGPDYDMKGQTIYSLDVECKNK